MSSMASRCRRRRHGGGQWVWLEILFLVLPFTPFDRSKTFSAMTHDHLFNNITLGGHGGTVGPPQRVKGADYALESIHNLREAVPELWKNEIKSDVAYPLKLVVETSVIA